MILSSQLATILENQVGLVERFDRLQLGGFGSSSILIQTEIPESLVKRNSIHGSDVGSAGAEKKEVTEFVLNQVLGMRKEWDFNYTNVVADMDINSIDVAIEHFRLFGGIKIENDGQFTVKVDIVDCKNQRLHLSCRADYLIVANRMITKDAPMLRILMQTIAFVEIQSGNKTMDEASEQLMLSLKAAAAFTGKGCLYGIVIDKNFTEARLIKHEFMTCLKNGIYHPSQLEGICEAILKESLGVPPSSSTSSSSSSSSSASSSSQRK